MEKDCQSCKLNREDAMDRKRWRKQIRDDSIIANSKYVSEIVLFNLLTSFVFPVMLYAIEAVNLMQKQISELSQLVCLYE